MAGAAFGASSCCFRLQAWGLEMLGARALHLACHQHTQTSPLPHRHQRTIIDTKSISHKHQHNCPLFSRFSGLNFNCLAIDAVDAIECFTCFHPAWRAELRCGLLEFRQLVLRQHAWKAAQSQGHGARWCEHVRVESSLRPLHKWLRMLRMARWHSQLTDTDWMVDVCWGGSVSWSQASLLLQGLPMFILHGFPLIYLSIALSKSSVYTSNLFAMSIHFFHHLLSSSIHFLPTYQYLLNHPP